MKDKKYKFRSGYFYKYDEEIFLYGLWLFVTDNKQLKLKLDIGIKNYRYDDIFWDIMHMELNSNEPKSLRACGAFTSPRIMIFNEEKVLTIDDELAVLIDELINRMESNISDFVSKYTVNEYVLEHYEGYHLPLLKVLAYVDMGMKKEALEIAKQEVKAGNSGGFQNGRRTFFEWACKRIR